MEVLDSFEGLREFSFNLCDEALWTNYPGLELRLRYLDILCEISPVAAYKTWVVGTLQTAKEVDDQGKIDFYKELLQNLYLEFREVYEEFIQCTPSFPDTDGDERDDNYGLDEDLVAIGQRKCRAWLRSCANYGAIDMGFPFRLSNRHSKP